VAAGEGQVQGRIHDPPSPSKSKREESHAIALLRTKSRNRKRSPLLLDDQLHAELHASPLDPFPQPPRLALTPTIIMPIMRVIAPAASQNCDPPMMHSQSAKHSTGHRRRIPAPCRNHNRPRSATTTPTSAATSCFRFIIEYHQGINRVGAE
jgi:hypothetical protein